MESQTSNIKHVLTREQIRQRAKALLSQFRTFNRFYKAHELIDKYNGEQFFLKDYEALVQYVDDLEENLHIK